MFPASIISDDSSMPAKANTHRDKRPRLDEYAEIDKRINDDEIVIVLREKFEDQLPKSKLAQLLLVIKEQSGRKLSKDLNDLAEKEDLIPIIQSCWKSKSYREVLESGHFPLASPSAQPPSYGEEDYDIQELKRAWKAPFQGEYHKVLFKNINWMRGTKPYENICAVLQGSGTGKSRMVDEQAKLVYTLPINIRDDSHSVAVYPPADRTLRTYLTDAPTDKDRCETYYQTFFRSLFHRAAEELSHLSKHDIANEWYKRMADADYRSKFHQSVVKLCDEGPRPDVREELEVLISKLNRLHHTEDAIKIIIYIDEVQDLKGRVQRDDTKLDALCSVIGHLNRSPLFCLLLSTQSSIRFLVPTKQVIFSERFKQSKLLAPITETPFDCAPDIKVKAGVLHIEDLYKADRIIKWGRPLWWTRGLPIKDLVELARVKLLCSQDINAKLVFMTRFALTAVSDVLLAFDFEPNHAYIDDVQAELVKSHMRIAYSVPSHQMYFQSGYPSEPVLAEAAAQQLWAFQKAESQKTTIFKIMEMVLEYSQVIYRSSIDLGEREELTMRMFLMCAYMDGVLKELGSQASDSGIVFGRGCALLTFIGELFKPKQAEKILGALPDNLINKTTLSQSFANSMVRLTHFVKAGDKFAITSGALCAAFMRGAAVIGHHTQKLVDIAIPILLDRKDTVRESNMSAILIQVKRHIKGSGALEFTFNSRDVNLFPEHENAETKKRPYIVLVAQLGITPEEGYVGNIKTPCIHVLPQPKKQRDVTDTHLRYNFVSYGGSVYKDVSEDQCATLLATRNFVDEHPWKESRDLVMRLKPFWEEGEDTYHWYEPEEEPEPVEEGSVEQVENSDESLPLSDMD